MESHAREIDIVLSSINLNSITSIQLEKVAEGIYFPNIRGKTLFRKKITLPPPRVYNANGITSSDIKFINESIKNLLKHKDLDKILRFHTQMRDKKIDEIKSFIFGWTALEIFINKNFNKYYKSFWDNLNQGNPIFIKFSNRVIPVLKDKLRLNDKFLIIVSSLNQDSELLNDLELFDNIKSLRDKYFHGQSINELPIMHIDILLKKYLNLHLISIGKKTSQLS